MGVCVGVWPVWVWLCALCAYPCTRTGACSYASCLCTGVLCLRPCLRLCLFPCLCLCHLVCMCICRGLCLCLRGVSVLVPA